MSSPRRRLCAEGGEEKLATRIVQKVPLCTRHAGEHWTPSAVFSPITVRSDEEIEEEIERRTKEAA